MTAVISHQWVDGEGQGLSLVTELSYNIQAKETSLKLTLTLVLATEASPLVRALVRLASRVLTERFSFGGFCLPQIWIMTAPSTR